MDIMIDTVCVVYALGVELGRIERDHPKWPEASASHYVLTEAEELSISAVAWYETLFNLREQEAAVLEPWKQRLFVLPVDARVAERASEIVRTYRSVGRVCTKCLSLLPHDECSKCGATPGRTLKNNDLLIVATADVNPDVHTLYTHDNGMLEIGKHVRKDLDVCKPPASPGVQTTIPLEQGLSPDTAVEDNSS